MDGSASVPASFALVWNTTADAIGTPATAALVRRAARRAAVRFTSLNNLHVERKTFTPEYSLPSAWISDPAGVQPVLEFQALLDELSGLLHQLTGTVVLRKVAQLSLPVGQLRDPPIRSLAGTLSDIAVVFSSADEPESRVARVLDLVQQLVPYQRCALVTLLPQEAFVTRPAGVSDDDLLRTARGFLEELERDEQHGDRSCPRLNAHLAVPLVNPDVDVVGLLLLVRESPPFDDTDLRVLATVAGQLASYVTWLQYRNDRTALLHRERIAREEADRANRAKDAFLATLSHELRSPLNAIVGWSDMLLRGKLPAETMRRAFEAIHRNGLAQAHLIDDVLDVSRIISGKLLIEKDPVDLNGVLQAAVESIRPLADDKNIDLVAFLPAGPLPLMGDSNRLQQVFSNLLSNAVKFTPEGGRVRLSTVTKGEQVRVLVEDSGIGIELDALPRVFDRFFQQDSSMTRRHTGLGLGLAIVQHIVQQHGGTVSVHSDGADKGAVFTVTLHAQPVAQAATEMQPPVPEDSAQPESLRLDGLSVLVLDDDAETRELVSAVLQQAGANATATGCADEAMAQIRATAPDIVVADIAMPEKDGIAFIRELREGGVAVPAVALSAHGRGEDRIQALEAGFEMHLAKPVLPRDLVMAVAVLARRSTGSL